MIEKLTFLTIIFSNANIVYLLYKRLTFLSKIVIKENNKLKINFNRTEVFVLSFIILIENKLMFVGIKHTVVNMS